MTVIDLLCAVLDRFYARHPYLAFALMILIAFMCMVGIAALNQDGMAVPQIYHQEA